MYHIVSYTSKPKGESAIPYYHIFSSITLPPANEIKGLKVEDQCSLCKRNGYFNDVTIGNLRLNIPTEVKPVELIYKSSVFKGFQEDVVLSWECLGLSNNDLSKGRIIRFARPLLLFSERFKESLTGLKIKGVEFTQVIESSNGIML